MTIDLYFQSQFCLLPFLPFYFNWDQYERDCIFFFSEILDKLVKEIKVLYYFNDPYILKLFTKCIFS